MDSRSYLDHLDNGLPGTPEIAVDHVSPRDVVVLSFDRQRMVCGHPTAPSPSPSQTPCHPFIQEDIEQQKNPYAPLVYNVGSLSKRPRQKKLQRGPVRAGSSASSTAPCAAVGEIVQSVPSARVNARSWPVVTRVRFPPRTATASFSTSDTPRVKSLPSPPPSPWLCQPGANRAGIGRAGGRGGSPGRGGRFQCGPARTPGSGSATASTHSAYSCASMWPGAIRRDQWWWLSGLLYLRVGFNVARHEPGATCGDPRSPKREPVVDHASMWPGATPGTTCGTH